MKRLIIAAVLFMLTGCGPNTEDTNAWGVRVWHDDERAVTCWIYSGIEKGGISCLPDSMVRDTQ